MPASVSTARIWKVLEREQFGVVCFTTARGEARSAGIVYVAQEGRLYFGTARTAWKTRHIARRASVSLTIPVAKRIPFLPWIRIPPATITFAGTARVLEPAEAGAHVTTALLRGLAQDDATLRDTVCIEVTPKGEFITYGIGVSLLTMMRPEQAGGRAPVSREEPCAS